MPAADPLQQLVIECCPQLVCNIVFRLGQKNGWAKIWDPKKGYSYFLPSHVFAQTRSFSTPVTLSSHDDRTNYVSMFGISD
jgi:hypothetical protein